VFDNFKARFAGNLHLRSDVFKKPMEMLAAMMGRVDDWEVAE
jgi:hypothetical protein